MYSTRFVDEHEGGDLLYRAARVRRVPVLKSMESDEATRVSIANLIATVRYFKAEIESVAPATLLARRRANDMRWLDDTDRNATTQWKWAW